MVQGWETERLKIIISYPNHKPQGQFNSIEVIVITSSTNVCPVYGSREGILTIQKLHYEGMDSTPWPTQGDSQRSYCILGYGS